MAENKKEVIEENEEFFNAKVSKNDEEKTKYRDTMFYKVSNVILWVVFIALVCIWLVDFFRVQNNNDPWFCFNDLYKDPTVYEDGNVYSCYGAGYKIYRYERTSMEGIEFGPFWISDRSSNDE